MIVQRHFLEMDEAEMARELHQPPSTVKWWLHTGRKRLKTLLSPHQNRLSKDHAEIPVKTLGEKK